jgi:hypothetical protein
VYFEEYLGEEPMEIHAVDHEEAATKFGELYNTRSDYCLMDSNIEVEVKKDDVVKYFRVGAEPWVRYTSAEI